ncbi:hypothetical protein HPB47_010813 [Ixodes persulcatus]|uniref:Uncharacterized protein n=1 Tax=Ixodes persulcatus TaxID=34615 RepID=A0AC60NY14_IXOPE|nr:hypothetical protein HPB47_010813 [Ixodes persulcatus]
MQPPASTAKNIQDIHRLNFNVAVNIQITRPSRRSFEVDALRPQVDEGTADLEKIKADAITTESTQDASSEKDAQVTVIDTLRDISKTLKEKFILLGDKIKEKMNQLKQAAGDQAQKIKSQLNDLRTQLKDSLQALKKKVQGFFDKGQYASFGEHAIEVFGKIVEIRDKLNEFIKGVKDVTGDKLRQMQELAKQLRQQIKMKVQELLHGSSDSQTAVYSVIDDDDVEDSEAYVIATLKDISKSLKEKFLLLVEHLKGKFAELKKAGKAYIIDTLKDISKALKEKFLVLGERIAQKVQEIKEALGQRAEVLKKQLQELKGQLSEASYALKKKVLEMIRPEQPAQYGMFDGISSAVSENLATLRTRLEKFLNKVQKLAGEKWVKMQETIRDLRNEIKQNIRKLLQGKAEVESTGAPEQTSAVPLEY